VLIRPGRSLSLPGGPFLPGVGDLRHRDEARGLVAVPHVDPEDVPDGESVVGSTRDDDVVARTDVSFGDDPQVRPRSAGLREQAREELVLHPHSQPPTGDAGLRDFEQGRPDLPALTHQRARDGDPLRGQVLSDPPETQGPSDGLGPPSLILDAVRVDGLVRSTMGAPVRLLVPFQVDAPEPDAPADRGLPDRAPGGAAFVVELADASDVHREDLARDCLHHDGVALQRGGRFVDEDAPRTSRYQRGWCRRAQGRETVPRIIERYVPGSAAVPRYTWKTIATTKRMNVTSWATKASSRSGRENSSGNHRMTP